jgi:hypothetical protein
MFYQNMPLYLQLLGLLRIEYTIFPNLPKAYKFSLGQDIINRTWNIIDLFIMAQTTSYKEGEDAKSLVVEQISQQFDCLKLRIRFLTELKLISLGQSAYMATHLVAIGKMIGSWQKHE